MWSCSQQHSAVAPGAGIPTGLVLFLTNGVSVGAPITLTDGGASFSISNLPHATNLISAQYAGNGNFNASSNSLSEIINSAPAAGYAYYSRPTNVALHIKISNLLTNATDADSDPITLFGVSAHSTNNATITTNGTFLTYLPPGINGNVTDTFTYTVSDTFGATNSGVVIITLLGDSMAQSANITGISSTNGSILVGFAGIPGYSYYIQASTNLVPSPLWVTLATNTAGPNGLFQFLDTQASNYPVRYYRTVSH